MVKAVIFDWGDTLMRDLPGFAGPMAFWPTVEAVAGVVEALQARDHSVAYCVASNAGASDACLMVGNDYDKDIVGAKQAGFLTAWVALDSTRLVPGTHADFVLRNMGELPTVIHRLRTGT